MHQSLMHFLSANTTKEEVCGKRILEVGSLSVNGSPREVFEPLQPSMYLGIDVAVGAGVNIQMSGYHLYDIFLPSSFDIVICTETLEHVQDWRQLVSQLKYALRPLGLLYFSCRAPGFHYHDYPGDYWRFTMGDISSIFSDLKCLSIQQDPEFPGTFLKAIKTILAQPPVILDSITPLEIHEGYCCSSI